MRGVGDCATKFGSLCANFIDMGPPVKNQVEIEFSKLFYFQGQKIGVSDESFCTLKDSNLCDKEGKVINISDPLGKTQRQLSHFLSFMMTVDTDQADPKFKCSRMTCRACVKLPLDVGGIETSIETQIINPHHYLLVH